MGSTEGSAWLQGGEAWWGGARPEARNPGVAIRWDMMSTWCNVMAKGLELQFLTKWGRQDLMTDRRQSRTKEEGIFSDVRPLGLMVVPSTIQHQWCWVWGARGNIRVQMFRRQLHMPLWCPVHSRYSAIQHRREGKGQRRRKSEGKEIYHT